MTPSDVSTQTADYAANSQEKYDLSPRKYEDDGVSKTPLIKKMFRRKLSGVFNQMNTGAHRPKSTGISSDGESDSEESAAAKKQRIQIALSEARKYGVDLSDSEEEEEENSLSPPPPSVKSAGKDFWSQPSKTSSHV